MFIHLIIEGPDNVGKNTIINNLLQHYQNLTVRHFTSPKGDSPEEKLLNQKIAFSSEFLFMKEIEKLSKNPNFGDQVLVWNRSHIGEAVYGPMYRNSKPDWIWELEETLNDNTLLILVYPKDHTLLIKNDDGLSFSVDPEKKQLEIKLFFEAILRSNIKEKVYLNVDGENGVFLPKNVNSDKIISIVEHLFKQPNNEKKIRRTSNKPCTGDKEQRNHVSTWSEGEGEASTHV